MSQLAFLADESCDFAVVRALRGAGYDVLAAVETCRGADDEHLIELARRSEEFLLRTGILDASFMLLGPSGMV
ncbi:MAG: DUF5615 family PIN-like protein [Bacillota bacterium]